MNTFNMTCEAVEATLPDYLDETLETWVRSSVEEHLGQCLKCAALVRDIRNIEREAGLLPDLVPVRDLWPGIESRIGTPVVAFTPAVVSETSSSAVVGEIPDITPATAINEDEEDGVYSIAEARSSGRRFSAAWLGVAAAALMVVTAGTTYLLTARSVETTPARVVVSPAAPVPVPDAVNPFVGNDLNGEASQVDSGPSGSSEAPSTQPRSRAPLSPRATSRLANRSATEAVYDKEILMLQSIMRWRKAELDPATAAIIDKNLKIIDAAIAQSRAALRRDPASSMISDQLTHALDKKVELLRTAAMLPSST